MPKSTQSQSSNSTQLAKKLNSNGLKSKLKEKSAARRKKQAEKTGVETAVASQQSIEAQPALSIINVPTGELKPSPTRARVTTDSQLENLIHSLKAFGQVLPIPIDQDGTIIAGHVVWEAANKLGLETTVCVEVGHLDEAELEALAIALNRTGETGTWDLEILGERLIILESKGIELASTGFSLQEIDQITLGGCEAEEQPDETSKQEEFEDFTPVVEPGDIFQLGVHRVVCGDALELSTYGSALDGRDAAMVSSDPPYNLPIKNFVSGLGKHKHEDFDQAVGELTGDEFQGFLKTYLAHCKASSSAGAVISVFMDWRQIEKVVSAGESLGLTRKNIVVWNKGSGGMGSLYRSAHEFNVIFCNGKMLATNNVELGRHGRDRTNVWSYPGANSPGSSAAKALADHPTPKSVAMIEDAILDVTKRGEVVLDPFLGSGTTLIACHNTGRQCAGIELDPKYLERAIRRWEAYTGEQAVHVQSGQSLDELATARSSNLEAQNG